eukprot:11290-Heterococcus_DN1.PRE.2
MASAWHISKVVPGMASAILSEAKVNTFRHWAPAKPSSSVSRVEYLHVRICSAGDGHQMQTHSNACAKPLLLLLELN